MVNLVPYALAFLAVAITAIAAPTVSSIATDQLTHSTMRVLFNVTGGYSYLRVRYIASPGTCSGGRGGTVQTPGTVPSSFVATGMTVDLSGLAPSTTYNVCPEVSSDNVNWSSRVQASFTTLALPSPHPALPIEPATFDTSYPHTSGYATVTTARDCSDYQTKLNTAVGNQLSHGTVIQIPAGLVCLAPTTNAANSYWTTPVPPDVKSFQAANLEANTGKITIKGHGFSNNQEVRLATNGCLMQTMGFDPFCQTRGILKGEPYYAQVIDANNFYLTGTPGGSIIDFSVAIVIPNVGSNNFTSSAPLANGYQLMFKSTGRLPAPLTANRWYTVINSGGATSLTFSLSGVTLTSAGSGTFSAVDLGGAAGTQQYIVGYPRALKPVIIRTSTPDNQFTPAGVRTSPAWKTKMATLKLTTVGNSYHNVIQGFGFLASNIRFVGIEFTHGDNSAEASTSNDPQPWYGLFTTAPDDSNIVIDRCYVHGLGYPNRLYRAFPSYDGHNMAIINSYLSNLDYWHSVYTGLTVTKTSNTQFTIAPGTHHMGAITPTLANKATVNFRGAGSGTAIVYFDMSGKFTVNFPPSITPGSCTGTGVACTVLNTQAPGTGSCSYSDAWPKNANGRTAAGAIACIPIVGGAIATPIQADAFSSVDATEGAQSFIAGLGPGPWIITNNYFSGSGIVMHFDDSGGSEYTRGDYTIQRNTFNTPFTEMFGGPISNGLRYGHRQPLEWKGGQRRRVDGNIFDGSFAEDTLSSVFVDDTPRAGGYSSDFDLTNNTFQHGPGGFEFSMSIDAYTPVSKPPQRMRAKNNLFWDINGWTYHSATVAYGLGWTVQSGYGNEDIIFDHNTVYDNRGPADSLMHWVQMPTEGMSITNNFLFYADAPLFVSENVTNCNATDKTFMDCAFISGPGHPSYTFAENVIIPSWTNSSIPSGAVNPSTVSSAFKGLSDTVVTGKDVPSRIASIGWKNPSTTGTPDFHLLPTINSKGPNPYLSRSTDGSAVGADIDALEAAQGKVRNVQVLSLQSSSAQIAFRAPDSFGCSVDYSTDTALGTFTRVDNRGGSRPQNVTLSGLTAGTTYYYRVNCAVEQPTGSFRTIR